MTVLVDRHSGIDFTLSHCRNFQEGMLIERHMHRPMWVSLSMTENEDLGPMSPVLLSYTLLYDTDMENCQGGLAMQSRPSLTSSIFLGKMGTNFLCPYLTAVLSAGRPELCQLLWRARPMSPL